MSKVTPFLWFDTQAEEAMNFYISIFKNSKIISVNQRDGKVFTVTFELEGQRFTGLNSGPMFRFNEAVSFYVDCETQDEVDYFWDKLSAGGQKSRCGWLKDKFGLSWQIVPTALAKLMGGPDPRKSEAVLQALLKMDKLEIAALQRAHDEA